MGKLKRVSLIETGMNGGLFGVIESAAKKSTWQVQADGQQGKLFYGATRAEAIKAYRVTTGLKHDARIKAVEIPRQSKGNEELHKMAAQSESRKRAKAWIASHSGIQAFLRQWHAATPAQRNWRPGMASTVESLDQTARRLMRPADAAPVTHRPSKPMVRSRAVVESRGAATEGREESLEDTARRLMSGSCP